MLQLLRDIIAPLVTKPIGDWLETKAIPHFIASISVSVGCYMLTQQVLGVILISLPILYLIYRYNHNNSIKNKLFIRDDVGVHCLMNNEDVIISLHYFIYNFSSHLINASINPDTKHSIKILDNNDQVLYTEQKPVYPNIPVVLPFLLETIVATHPLLIPFKEGMKIGIKCNLIIDYYSVDSNTIYRIEKPTSLCCTMIKRENLVVVESVSKLD